MRRRSEIAIPKSLLRWVGVALLTVAGAILNAWVAADALIVRSDLAHAEALVVLAGSSTYLERTRHAAQLFREGRAALIILTNDNQTSGWSAEAERNPLFIERAIDELKNRGVPIDNIEVVPGRVWNTHDEVMRIREYVGEKKLRSILVVTSAYQSRRALWTLRQVFRGSGIEVGLDAVEPGEQSPGRATWWRSRLGWQLVPGEYLKLVYYGFKY
jgi:uncharacterized SAM-binding protein YcdF (DUF218 family)